jgi:hypothetical protein
MNSLPRGCQIVEKIKAEEKVRETYEENKSTPCNAAGES